jgi:DNA-binding winged helix-turn-helix (wHTH) protein
LSILIALAERAGEVVSKRELHALIWPNEVVEEGTLRVHVAVLRKVLGERPREHQLIQNVHGRGYRLAVPVTELSAASPQAAESKSTDRISEYPLIGRDESIQRIAATLYENRLVTVTGPGGIGKTAAARGVVDALAPGFAENVWIVDMAPVEAPARSGNLGRFQAWSGGADPRPLVICPRLPSAETHCVDVG